MRVRTVSPDTKVLPLSDGDWIRVKVALGVGEARSLLAAGFKTATGMFGGRMEEAGLKIDWVEQSIARVMTWVDGWSFIDAQGKPLPFNREVVCALDEETFDEINKALDAHVEEVEARKKQKAGSSESAPTSS